jgi:acylphosphatase
MVTVELVISGTVQGVGFRNHTKRQAMKHSVTGWVQNKSDGTVHTVLQGDKSEVESVLAALRSGPRLADVTNIERIEVTEPEQFQTFSIRR